MARWQSRLPRGAVRILALWMAVTWSGIPQAIAQSAEEQREAARAVAQLQNSLLAIEDARQQAPRDRWDPQYVVDTVGIDPTGLFEWVRREVRWVPYRGSLRGPVGVLMDRNGNSLDQSLLLAALLHDAGREVRLAHADLSDDLADQVWQNLAAGSLSRAVPTPPAAGASPSAPAADSSVAANADLYGFNAAEAVKSVDDSARKAAELEGRLDRRVLDQGLRLLKMVQLPPAAAAKEAASAIAFASLRDHWWVQMRDGSTWMDLDPLHPSGEVGHALLPAKEVIATDALPPTAMHRVVLRVVAEQLKAGKTQEHVILDHELKPSELIGEKIALRHFPMLWPSDFQAITPEDVNTRMFAALATQTEWLPVLDVGENHFKNSSIHDTGVVNPKPSPPGNPFLNIGASAAGSAAASADMLRGGNLLESNARVDAPKDARADGELTAEWIEYEIDVPGAKPRIIRREVFDILGASARETGSLAGFQLTPERALARSMAMLTETELLVLPCEIASDFVLEMASRTALANRDFATDLTSDPFGKAPANSTEVVAKMAPLPGPAYALASLRFTPRLDPGTVFVDQPTILAQHAVLTSAGPGALAVKVGLDIVAHPVGVDPFGSLDPPFARIIQGVADTNAESLSLPDGDKVGSNTAEAFDKNEAADWQLLTPADEAEVAKLGLDPDVSARLVADLREGNFVVAGKTSAAGGWWRINPATGETLGIGPNGWGQAMVEYAFVLVIQMYLAQIACLVQANVMGKIDGTINTAADAHANARKNFNHCLTFAFLGVLNGMTTAYFMNRLQTTSSSSTPSAPSSDRATPNGRPPGKGGTQPLQPRGKGNTQPVSPGGPPPGTSPPAPSASPRPGPAPSGSTAPKPGNTTPLGKRPLGGGPGAPHAYTDDEVRQAMQQATDALSRFEAKDKIAQQMEARDNTFTPAQKQAADEARIEAERARAAAIEAEGVAGRTKALSEAFYKEGLGAGARFRNPAPPPPPAAQPAASGGPPAAAAPPAPAPGNASPLAVSGLSFFDSALKGL